MAKNNESPPYGALHLITSQPTPIPAQPGDTFRVLEVKSNKSSGLSVIKLVGPIAIPQGVEDAIDRISNWIVYVEDHIEFNIPNPYAGVPSTWEALLEDCRRVRAWRERMKGNVEYE